MTLEPNRDEHQKNTRFARGKKRKQQILQRSHRRELKALEHRVSLGTGLTEQETARLATLREIYD